ncbi:hypothetical protein GTP41_12455 [Pseudoduganella sp. DS3]|uniref:Uncharacterized protein n=1 Tax=Pseudoduganella guangdongensis TaxID=2692179 RepID=A0A6N9HIQ9_9BURK|nr:hypothetical protein [Pseudoduganella guangdongensis]MYN02912.1 hypothetical protein [Pseudoduganella guangdongensis]
MKRLKLGMTGFLLLVMGWFAFCIAAYRIPGGPERSFDGEVYFKIMELEDDNRSFFEGILGNRRLRILEAPVFYVSASDKSRLWQTSPFELEDKRETLRVRVKAKPLLFGGYDVAEIESVKQVSGEPYVRK